MRDINSGRPSVWRSWADTSVKSSSCSPPSHQPNQNKGCVDPRRTSTLTWMLFQWEGRHEMRNAILCLLLPASLKLPQLSGRGDMRGDGGGGGEEGCLFYNWYTVKRKTRCKRHRVGAHGRRGQWDQNWIQTHTLKKKNIYILWGGDTEQKF